jgi:glycine/sarcosine N-methyltransferase
MAFYESIASYYDYIFYPDDNQKFFFNKIFKKKLNLLDIGSATGNLSIYLSKTAKTVTGIDLDMEMISIANVKLEESKILNTNFFVKNMNDVDTFFKGKSFDSTICIGNTLVHLNSVSMIADFFCKVRKILKNDGLFIFQILNYEKILENGIKELPLIENDKIKFERYYGFHKDKNLIDFKTVLTVKNENKVIENSVFLYPLVFNEIKSILKESKFVLEKIYGNYQMDDFNSQSDLLVCVLRPL